MDNKEEFILKVDQTPTSVGVRHNKLVLMGVQSPSKIKPPAGLQSGLDVLCQQS